MKFESHEKMIYSPPDSDRKFDPLAIERALQVATRGKLSSLVTDWNAVGDTRGAIGPDADAERKLVASRAEEELVKAARFAFDLPTFPESLDAQALEWLSDWLDFMAKKGRRSG